MCLHAHALACAPACALQVALEKKRAQEGEDVKAALDAQGPVVHTAGELKREKDASLCLHGPFKDTKFHLLDFVRDFQVELACDV